MFSPVVVCWLVSLLSTLALEKVFLSEYLHISGLAVQSTALGDLAAADGVALPLMLGAERPIRGEGSMPLCRLAYSSERPIL